MLHMIESLESLMRQVAPALVDNPLPLLIVAGFILANAILFALTKGREFTLMGWTALLFLVPFVKFG